MKKNLHLIIISAFAAVILISGTLASSNSPGKKSGSPLDGNNCTQCHSGAEVSAVDWITTTIPETGWVPGETYTVTASAVHTTAQKIGFELTAENDTIKTGKFALVDAEKSKLLYDGASATHTSAGILPVDGEISWTFDWTAPDRDRGDITFYAAFNAANGNGNTSGDSIFTSSLTFQQDPTTTSILSSELNPLKLYPNPFSEKLYINSPDGILQITVYDIDGKALSKLDNVSSQNIDVNTRSYKSGLYIIKTKTTNGYFTNRVLKK